MPGQDVRSRGVIPAGGDRSPSDFADRLAARIDQTGSALCVGLDPVVERLPGGLLAASGAEAPTAFARFDEAVIDAVKDHAAAVKFQSACYERYGAAGWEALAGGIELARATGLIVILDAKRGDIGISAEHYAAAAAALDADAVTVSAYLGTDAIEPFLDAGLGAFGLVRTSNPGSDEIQAARLEDGRTVAEFVAARLAELGDAHVGARGLSGVGAVVGATKAAAGEFSRLRAAMPDQIALVPGVGVQGGRVADLAPLVRSDAERPADAGLLVTASRSVIYAFAGKRSPWHRQVTLAAKAVADQVRELIEAV